MNRKKTLFIKRLSLENERCPQQESPLTPSSNIFSTAGASSTNNKLSKISTHPELSLKQTLIQKTLQLPSISNPQLTNTSGCTVSGINDHKRLSKSKFTAEQINYVTRDKRNMKNLQKYQKRWLKIYRKDKLKGQEQPRIFYQLNPQKDDLILDNIKNYWKMSLRNHDNGVLKYLNGAPFDETSLKVNLQTLEGTTQVERSIPRVPFDKRRRQGFLISGVNKSQVKGQLTTQTNPRSFSVEQVLKSDWRNKGMSKIYIV